MAAKSSCTHLSWSDAKGPVGLKVKKPNAKLSHTQILAQRIKDGGKFVEKKKAWSRHEIDKHVSATERAERDAAAAAVASIKAAEDEEAYHLSRISKPHERARARMSALANELQGCAADCSGEDLDAAFADSGAVGCEPGPAELRVICECCEQQLDEIMVLESIYAETGELLVADSSGDLEELRETLEAIQEADFQDLDAMRRVAKRAPLAFVFQLAIVSASSSSPPPPWGEQELEACVVLHVSLPPLYPTAGHLPRLKFKDVMITDVRAECLVDKQLDSLAYLGEELREGMLRLADATQPGVCVHELVTHLQEHAFEFAHMRTHLAS